MKQCRQLEVTSNEHERTIDQLEKRKENMSERQRTRSIVPCIRHRRTNSFTNGPNKRV